MGTFILIVLLYKGGGVTVEFDNRLACEEAQSKVLRDHSAKFGGSGPAIAICVPKK